MAQRKQLVPSLSRLPHIPSDLLIALFGLVLVAAAWLVVTQQLSADRTSEIERIHRENSALARTFEEHVRRVIQTADNTLLNIKREFETRGGITAGLIDYVAQAKRDPMASQIGVVDSRGLLVVSAVPHEKAINISQNPTFRVHAASPRVGLYIGKPFITQLAGTLSFYLTRRLNHPDGSFAGVATLGLDPAYFSDFYNELEVGSGRAVLLAGRDGIVRARRFPEQSEAGQDLSGTALFARLAQTPVGHHEIVGPTDKLRRFASYRALPDLPLVVVVSDLASSALAPFERRRTETLRSLAGFTLFVAVFCSVLIAAGRRERRQNELLSIELAERLRAEAALRETSESYRDLFENANDAIFLLDDRHRYVDANRRASELFGYTREEFLGRSVLEFIPPEQARRSEATFRELVERGQYNRFEGRLQAKDGRWLDIEVNSSAIVRDGVFAGSRDIVRDITERKRVEAEGNRLLKAISYSTEGIAITDDQDRFIYVNDAHALIFGRLPGEMQGKTWRDTVPPDLIPSIESDLSKTLHNKAVGYWGGECPALRKDGTVLPTEITATALWDDTGAYLGHICSVRNNTERKEIEEKIRQSERFIRSILDTVDEGFIVVDRDYRILTANRAYCRQASLPNELVLGRRCFEISHRIDKPCFEAGEECAVRRAFETGEAHAAVHKHPGPNGHLLFVETKAFPIKDQSGTTTSVIETLNNITEKHLLEEERLKTQKLESIGTLAGGIAHDFNNLLQGIFGYISMAKMCIDQKERSLAMIEQAEKAIQQSVSLTTQLLTFSRGGKPAREPIQLEPVLENAVRFALSGSRTEYRLVSDPGLWRVDADAGQLGQVIQNIALNADQAMPLGGSVEITARNVPLSDPDLPAGLARRNHVMISIRDNGAGIPEQDLERIFDPYFTTKEKGSGLGLATSYSIVRNHEGWIFATSEVGRGSTFVIYLPASDAVAAAPQGATIAAGMLAARILVMDDEEIIRNVTGELLTVLGHTVAFADRGETAIETYRAARDAGRTFDLVILDLTIRGGMGGVETVARLREIDPDVKAVASSGYSDDATRSAYREQGFTAFLKKPYNIKQLRDLLSALLA